jgi:vacuolar-type H+-ATPase subunit I/STV1
LVLFRLCSPPFLAGERVQKGNKVNAIAVKGGWLLLLPSLLFYFLLKQPPLLGILTLVGQAGIVFFSSPSRNIFARFFNGLYALYGLTSYFSDTLSYSRLLALGLSTGGNCHGG